MIDRLSSNALFFLPSTLFSLIASYGKLQGLMVINMQNETGCHKIVLYARDSPGQEQREITVPVRIDRVGPRTGPCLADSPAREQREIPGLA